MAKAKKTRPTRSRPAKKKTVAKKSAAKKADSKHALYQAFIRAHADDYLSVGAPAVRPIRDSSDFFA